MSIERVHVSGFKSIAHLDLELRSVNVLIGANGSGKSNLISLFTFLRHLAEERLQSYVNRNGSARRFLHQGSQGHGSPNHGTKDHRSTNHGTQTHRSQSHDPPKSQNDESPKIVIDVNFDGCGYHVELSYDRTRDELLFEDEYCKAANLPRRFSVHENRKESSLGIMGDKASWEVQRFIREYMGRLRVHHFYDVGPNAPFQHAQSVHDDRYLYSDGRNLGPVLYSLQREHPKNYREIMRALQVVAPFIHGFHFEERGDDGEGQVVLRWQQKGHDEPLPAACLSDGTVRFACLATLLLMPVSHRPSVILLDEPELGLHSYAMEVVAELIASVAKETQVICATESSEFANHFEPEDIIVVDQSRGHSEFTRPNREKLEVWLDDFRMGDLWRKNLIGGQPGWLD